MTLAQLTCPHCGAAVSANARFCRTCGKALELARQAPLEPLSPPAAAAPSQPTCPHCGAAISPTARFCRACGKPVLSAISTAGATPVAAATGPAIPAPPQNAQPAQTPPTPRPRSKRRPLLLGCCVGIPILCLVSLVGGYFAFRSGVIRQTTLLNLVGLGPGSITIMNLSDAAIQVTFTPVKDSKDGESAGLNLKLSVSEVSTREATPGKYRIEILRESAGASMEGACTMTLRSGDRYRYVALPNGIIVDRANSPSKKAEDLVPETSAFCR
jgi:ribosomal protein L40E